MADQETTVQELKQIVQQFVTERDWKQFHSPKNLGMSMSIEVAELMEHYQWLTTEQSLQAHHDSETCTAVSEELADVLCYVLAFANETGIDLSQALRDKMVKNRKKYPAEEYQGRY